MASWPATLPAPSAIVRDPHRRRILHQFESGDSGCIEGAARMRRRFELSWELMSPAEYAILESFFEANSAAEIAWTDPQRGTVHVVRFGDDAPIRSATKGRLGWLSVGPVLLVEV